MNAIRNYSVTTVLLIGVVFCALALASRFSTFRMPGNHQDYSPDQPVAFSHRLHAGELTIDCLYCHAGAEKSRYAGIPTESTCMNCHKYVTAAWGAYKEDQTAVSTEIQKLYNTLGLDENREFDPEQEQNSLEWMKVHNLPDFVYFDHRPHVTAGVKCQSCHGPVESMERMHQVENLSMGWCINCHRKVNETGVGGKQVYATLDCSICHY